MFFDCLALLLLFKKNGIFVSFLFRFQRHKLFKPTLQKYEIIQRLYIMTFLRLKMMFLVFLYVSLVVLYKTVVNATSDSDKSETRW